MVSVAQPSSGELNFEFRKKSNPYRREKSCRAINASYSFLYVAYMIYNQFAISAHLRATNARPTAREQHTPKFLAGHYSGHYP